MKREVAAEIVDSLKEAGIDFFASLTETNLHDLIMALGEDRSRPTSAKNWWSRTSARHATNGSPETAPR